MAQDVLVAATRFRKGVGQFRQPLRQKSTVFYPPEVHYSKPVVRELKLQSRERQQQ
jgi:hypothetical protein